MIGARNGRAGRASFAQVDMISRRLLYRRVPESRLLKYFKVSNILDLAADQVSAALTWIDRGGCEDIRPAAEGQPAP